jgi:serine/threonine-protein kinase
VKGPGTSDHLTFKLREARTAASLSHPHIVPIHAVEERDGLVFFVMTLVDGESLGAQAHPLGDHDMIEIAGIKMEFYYRP